MSKQTNTFKPRYAQANSQYWARTTDFSETTPVPVSGPPIFEAYRTESPYAADPVQSDLALERLYSNLTHERPRVKFDGWLGPQATKLYSTDEVEYAWDLFSRGGARSNIPYHMVDDTRALYVCHRSNAVAPLWVVGWEAGAAILTPDDYMGWFLPRLRTYRRLKQNG